MGVFLGKTPSFSHIQSVLTHILGRGMKLEIHLQPESRSMLVRIPISTIRKKIVEQEFWHIDNVLFYVAQWSDSVAMQPPVFTTMPLWAHFKGIPFDLYTQEGLGRVGDRNVERSKETMEKWSLSQLSALGSLRCAHVVVN